jgi:tetratricopeptide (TPR) repeat protein
MKFCFTEPCGEATSCVALSARRWLLLCVAAACMPGIALADDTDDRPAIEPTQADDLRDEEARTRFKAATMAFSDGRFEDALSDFQRAYELSGRVELLFNIGSAADRLRRDNEALAAYQAYLEASEDPPNRRFVEARLRMLRERGAEQEAKAQTVAAPTPEEAAKTSAAERGAQDPYPAGEPSDTGVRSRWWLWTGVGVVVVGAILTAVLLSTRSTRVRDAPLGDDGQVHEALRVGW